MRGAREPNQLKIAALVLAAGASTRLGEPKQNVRLGGQAGETLLERAVRVAKQAGLEPVWVVVAPGHSVTAGEGAVLLLNSEAAEGMASSIRTGIAAAISAELDGVVILACDQPAVTAEHLRTLARSRDETVASAYAGRRGVPAYFPRMEFKALMELRGDMGAREILREARAIPLDKGEVDIDTAEDRKRARELFPGVPPSETEPG
jgi:molybdenum cofactor cytidylyltransferase